MTVQLYLVFVAASALLIATPGPNVALIAGTSLAHGARSGLMSLAGVNLGLVLQLATLAAGLTWIVDLFARHFDLIRYGGALYLAALGLQQLLTNPSELKMAATMSAERAFARGFAVAFANPKTLIFHAAFLPQFLTGGTGTARELWLLATTFAAIAAAGDVIWVLGAARVRKSLGARAQRLTNRISGVVLLGGAAVILAARR